jgi:hypothetical protein
LECFIQLSSYALADHSIFAACREYFLLRSGPYAGGFAARMQGICSGFAGDLQGFAGNFREKSGGLSNFNVLAAAQGISWPRQRIRLRGFSSFIAGSLDQAHEQILGIFSPEKKSAVRCSVAQKVLLRAGRVQRSENSEITAKKPGISANFSKIHCPPRYIKDLAQE